MTEPPGHSAWMRKRGRLARLSEALPHDDPEVVGLRAELRLDRAGGHVEKLIAETPPLSDAQRTQLVELLKPVRRQARPTDLGGAA